MEIKYTHNSIDFKIPVPNMAYINRMLKSDSYAILHKLFKNNKHPAKEITESFGCFNNVNQVCNVSDYTWLHIGDGAYARTAAIFSIFSKSHNISIDPLLNEIVVNDWINENNIKRLDIIKSDFEKVNIRLIKNIKPYNIACVHSHTDLTKIDKMFPDWEYLYTNPCCMPKIQTFPHKYMHENNITEIMNENDLGILSHLRQVIIYKKIH